MNKKAQTWTVDFILGMVMFILLVMISVKAIYTLMPNQDYNLIYGSTVLLSDTLMSGGHPSDWNNTNVILPGVIDDSRVNATKLSRFDNLNYNSTLSILHLEHQYIFYFSNGTNIVNISRCVRGYPVHVTGNCNIDLSSIKYDNLVKIERIVIYNGTILKMVVYGWK